MDITNFELDVWDDRYAVTDTVTGECFPSLVVYSGTSKGARIMNIRQFATFRWMRTHYDHMGYGFAAGAADEAGYFSYEWLSLEGEFSVKYTEEYVNGRDYIADMMALAKDGSRQ